MGKSANESRWERHVAKWEALGWNELTAKFNDMPYFQAFAKRMYPAYRLLHGDMEGYDETEFIRECARLTALLITHEAKAEVAAKGDASTANVGGIQVIREDFGGLGGPNYRIVLHGAFVNQMRLFSSDY